MALFQDIRDIDADAESLRRRRYGVIEAIDGRFHRVLLRPFPKLISIPEILLLGGLTHRRRSGNRFLLYYDQPRRFPNFLAVKYIVSTRHTTYATCCRALEALDEIARIKRTDALLANVANWRISRRLLTRWGWQPHCQSRWQRHYIKRFYGEYPRRPAWLVAEDAATESPPFVLPMGTTEGGIAPDSAVVALPENTAY